MSKFFPFLPIAALILVLSGCSLFRDNRPEPVGSPYADPVAVRTPASYSEAEAVNAAVSAVSLRLAAASVGPFRLVPVEGKVTAAGYQMLDSLSRMRFSRFNAPYLLLLEDGRTGNGEWRFTLRTPQGEIFCTQTYLLKGTGR